MLNKVILSGRITRDLEMKQTPQGSSVLTFTIAVDRNFVKQGEERQTDFITCVAWNKTAEFISRFFHKGRSIAIIGNLRTRTYDDKNGTKHYVTEVFVDEAQFTFEPKAQQGGYPQQGGYQQGGYPQQGGYQNNAPYQGGYQNNGQQNNYPTAPAPAQDHGPAGNAPAPNISGLDDFEVLSDDGVPF